MSDVSIEDLEAAVGVLNQIGEQPKPQQEVKPQQAPAAASTTLELVEYVNPEELKADVEISFNDLDNAVREHASKYVYYATQASHARRQADRMKVTKEVTESRLYALHREMLVAEGKKATEAQVEAAVKNDPRWFAMMQKLADANAIADLANDAREAFRQRRDMLVQLTVDRRVEREGELRIKGVMDATQAGRQAVLSALDARRENAA